MYVFMHACMCTCKIWYELSPKFNFCKMEYLFILRFKGPLRFSMFGTRLSFKQFWLCLFLNGLRDFGCRASFLEALRSCKALFNLVPSLRCSTLLFEVEGLACFYGWMDGVSDFAIYAWLHFLPGQSTRCKFQRESTIFLRGIHHFSKGNPPFFWESNHFSKGKCFKQSCKTGLVLMRQPPSKVKKSWNCLRFLLRFAFGLGELNKTNNPSISFM